MANSVKNVGITKTNSSFVKARKLIFGLFIDFTEFNDYFVLSCSTGFDKLLFLWTTKSRWTIIILLDRVWIGVKVHISE